MAQVVKNLSANARDMGSIPGSERSPGGGNGHPLNYPFWDSPMDRGACGLQSMGSQRVRQTEHTVHEVLCLTRNMRC